MCTAITYRTNHHYFGRTLDLEYTYAEAVTVTPRRFPLYFRRLPTVSSHYAFIGMAMVAEGYPLYYEAANEWGLAIAGLNFPENARYFPADREGDNLAPFELIPWLLSRCKTLAEVRTLLPRIRLCQLPFSEQLPLTPLHWLIADREGALTVESVEEGLKVYENPVGVLTNSPDFPYQMTRLCDYGNLTPGCKPGRLGSIELPTYSRGMGAIGLPGDCSSTSRFVRAAFVKQYAVSAPGEAESVSQFFHILDTVAQPRGSVRLPDSKCVLTQYTSCINTDTGVYYYTTYRNRSLSAVDMHRCALEGDTLSVYPLTQEQPVYWHN